MKSKNLQYLSYFFVILFIAFIIIAVPKNYQQKAIENPTGSLSFQEPKTSRYAYTLATWVTKFFNIKGIIFPKSECTDVAEEFIENFLKKEPKVTEQFTTTGSQRTSSLLFGIEQEFVGAIEMIYGKDLVNKERTDSVLNFWVEGVVRLPKLTRASEIEVTLYGVCDDYFYVQSGKFTTPMLECNFTAKEDGSADCNCKTGRTHEYVNE